MKKIGKFCYFQDDFEFLIKKYVLSVNESVLTARWVFRGDPGN